MDKAAIEAEIKSLSKQIDEAIDEIDNNYKLSGPAKREKRKELNKLQAARNRLQKQLDGENWYEITYWEIESEYVFIS